MFLLDIPEPKNCDDCMFCDYERGFCYFSTTDGTLKTTKSVIEYTKNCTKPDWCPASKKFEEVYVITSGEYSDYGINAVTVSKERAEKLQKYYSRDYPGGEANIEEYFIDCPHIALDDLIPVYSVTIERNGTCHCYRAAWMHESTHELVDEIYCSKDKLIPKLKTDRNLYPVSFLEFNWYLPAKDEEHALKIAQDKRAMLLEKYYMDKNESNLKKEENK